MRVCMKDREKERGKEREREKEKEKEREREREREREIASAWDEVSPVKSKKQLSFLCLADRTFPNPK